MSRYYDAVQEASRHRQVGDLLQAQEPSAPPQNEIVAPQSPVEVAQLAAVPIDSEPAAPEVVAPWGIAEEQQLAPDLASKDEKYGRYVRVLVDKKVPLLTRAVDSSVVEYYRRLRTKIIQQQAIKAFHSLIVTSANPQEGKTVTALNLALIFAMLPSFRVLVVDADLRRGGLSKCLGLDGDPGFGNLLDDSAEFKDVVLTCDEFPISFMLRGNSQVPAGELLNSAPVSENFKKMTDVFDLVLVDTPPLNLITDTQLLAPHCDAMMLVARAFSTTRKSLEKASVDIQAFRVIGTVLNAIGPQNIRRYRGYY